MNISSMVTFKHWIRKGNKCNWNCTLSWKMCMKLNCWKLEVTFWTTKLIYSCWKLEVTFWTTKSFYSCWMSLLWVKPLEAHWWTWRTFQEMCYHYWTWTRCNNCKCYKQRTQRLKKMTTLKTCQSKRSQNLHIKPTLRRKNLESPRISWCRRFKWWKRLSCHHNKESLM